LQWDEHKGEKQPFCIYNYVKTGVVPDNWKADFSALLAAQMVRDMDRQLFDTIEMLLPEEEKLPPPPKHVSEAQIKEWFESGDTPPGCPMVLEQMVMTQ
jgi:hypothetical protein